MEGQKVIVLEQANAIGTETSSRNSEVIHSGRLSREIVRGHTARIGNKSADTHIHTYLTPLVHLCRLGDLSPDEDASALEIAVCRHLLHPRQFESQTVCGWAPKTLCIL